MSINTGNMFQLMTVDGITQELAAHILHYREKKVRLESDQHESHTVKRLGGPFPGPVQNIVRPPQSAWVQHPAHIRPRTLPNDGGQSDAGRLEPTEQFAERPCA